MNRTSTSLTEPLKAAILSRCFRDQRVPSRLCLKLGNYRLDFAKTYFFNGFTKKGVKLSWLNGTEELHVIGKIQQRNDYYRFYTEGGSFIEHIKLSEVLQ